ncbi:uncharacterized protein I303_104925 [Kwoniella dejecticola CBS 10117]|uniref:NmrA-like domain-containing protein n=1 Tax=Kwoniella dejecticola CBS 10117 TaxID=1296121 RepID=A0A1A6A3Z0_9TREE|nr:uncharacterized protein I303_05629 [Kwoniella dejecticola CBS 10117]OBR84770.1 hypothetical protein I303_05629 [Kwoniella dejecticola CBS 10117]
MTTKTIIVFGATGVQGKGLIEALSPHAEFNIIALSRNPLSSSSKYLASLPRVKVIKVPDNCMEEPSKVFQSLDLQKGDVYGVFSVQGYVDDTTMIRQGKAIADTSVQFGVKHIVYSSVDFAGLDDTKFSTFECKRAVENHILTLPIRHTFLRPVQFMDIWLPDVEAQFKMGRTVWAKHTYYKNPNKKHQLISSRDIGIAGARAFVQGREGPIRLAGDELSVKEIQATYKEVMGHNIAFSPSPLAWFVKQVVPVVKQFAKFFEETGYNVPIAEVRKEFPEFEDYRSFLLRHKNKK